MPKRISVRNAAESSLRAASVASIEAGGFRQLSQLPQAGGGVSPKWRSSTARRQVAVSTSPPSAFSRCALALLPVRADLLGDPAPRAREILGAPEQMRHRRIAVAPGAAGLLIIGLDRFGQAGMGDEAHVGLVDAHAERDRRAHHHVLGADEIALVAARTAGSSPA